VDVRIIPRLIPPGDGKQVENKHGTM